MVCCACSFRPMMTTPAGAACAGYGVRQQGADGVGADVRAQAVRLAQDHGAQVLARGVHHEVRAAFACDIRAQGRGLRDDHLARAVGLEQHGIVEADRPAAQHQRGLARQDAHRVHRAHDAVHRLSRTPRGPSAYPQGSWSAPSPARRSTSAKMPSIVTPMISSFSQRLGQPMPGSIHSARS